MLSIFCMQANTPEFSMYKKNHKAKTNEQKYFKGNTAGGWAIAGGSALFLGSMLKVFSSSQETPNIKDFTDLNDYQTSLDKYNSNQKSINTGFYICTSLSGFCFIISGIELACRPVVVTEKVTLKFKTTPSTVGLCLNFK